MTNGETEKRLWDVANNLRANSKLSPAEYSTPVLGLLFLRHADFKFTKKQKELEGKNHGSRRGITKLDYQAEGVLFLPEKSRYSYLLKLPEGLILVRLLMMLWIQSKKRIQILKERCREDILNLIMIS